MLVMRKEQMEVFRLAALKRFEDEMVAHSQEFSPELFTVLGEEKVRIAVRGAISRAYDYGFSNRGPIRLFIELMFLFGAFSDTDPQYCWIGSILRDSSDQMLRAERLYEKTLDYQEKVSGPAAKNTKEALRNLSIWAQRVPAISADDFIPSMLSEVHRIFPQKASYVGEEALQTLIGQGYEVARKANFQTNRGYILMVALMFAFGHGCADDPLYPWIANTLKDERIVDSAARENRLERKALTWLDNVLANT